MGSSQNLHRILVADDEPTIGSLVKEALGKCGHYVQVCEDGETAFDIIQDSRFSLLILDVMMPGRTGLQLLLELRSQGRKTPVILVTGTAFDEAVTQCEGLERVFVLAKPFTISQLKTAIQRLSGTVKS